MLKRIVFLGIIIATLVSCAQKEARKPVNIRSGTFLKESVERNKALVAKEEAMIQKYIQRDSANTYLASKNGFWYFYNTKAPDEETYLPQKGDTLTYEFDAAKIAGNTIYKKEEFGIQEYVVDKQQVIPGLRFGLQLMKKGETVTFLFPSHIAYGYHGDNKKIGTNIPIKSTITLLDIKKDNKNLETEN
ncbi:gliding motility-associated peptidyl-prolyl isomerase GldI [Kordia algicida OT-1]|uniref:Peptidyl-prolyl cis-trans isomerase n=1 Tax=Kordia algicida OT-1 TaxID=391587 RepID=A9ECN5_9FLAO|nr:gliding motility-associated peptidyl-prolyl isomerase GldI [Kordia algicida]EDP94393.1 macrophage infectivity potentiator [Kordia algicida OT-1]